ncbi:MAG: hypothetical protein H0U57_01735 [Tatlockia sp.]|nr:hypothetical protein [Tatlockia sp.]
MFSIEFDGQPIKCITIIGRIVKITMSTEDGKRFAEQYSITTLRPEEDGVEVEMLLQTLPNQRILQLFLNNITEDYLSQSLKQEYLEWYKESNHSSIDNIINSIRGYSYFHNHDLMKEETPILKKEMPVYMDLIHQTSSLLFMASSYPANIIVNGMELATKQVFETLLASSMHQGLLNKIEKTLERYEQGFMDEERLIAKIQRTLTTAYETPFPDFEKLSPVLGKELEANTLFYGEKLNDLYFNITQQINEIFKTNKLEFKSQIFPHPDESKYIVVDLEKREFRTPMKMSNARVESKIIKQLLGYSHQPELLSTPRPTPRRTPTKLTTGKVSSVLKIGNIQDRDGVTPLRHKPNQTPLQSLGTESERHHKLSSVKKQLNFTTQNPNLELNVAENSSRIEKRKPPLTPYRPATKSKPLFFDQKTQNPQLTPVNNKSSNTEGTKNWELSCGQMLLLLLFPPLGWPVLIAYAIYHSPCYPADDPNEKEDDSYECCC